MPSACCDLGWMGGWEGYGFGFLLLAFNDGRNHCLAFSFAVLMGGWLGLHGQMGAQDLGGVCSTLRCCWDGGNGH